MTPLTLPDRFYMVCRAVITGYSLAPNNAALSYAASYARAGLNMTLQKEMKIQLLYMQSNLSTWRGPTAQSVKAQLQSVYDDLKKEEIQNEKV